jgi:hypothetical protein
MNSINKLASELVSALHLVSREIREEAQATANARGIPFGRVLVMRNLIGEGDLTTILKAAWLVDRNDLAFVDACFYLNLALHDCEPIEEVIYRFKETSLGLLRFLIRAGILKETMLIPLNSNARLRRTTLGKLLTEYELISQEALTASIDILTLMRKNCVSSDQAIALIRLVHFYQYSVTEALNQTGAVPKVVAECRKDGVALSSALYEITRPMRILDDNMMAAAVAPQSLSAAVA